jgi:uncharacterized protein YbjT (DUF2867 family)
MHADGDVVRVPDALFQPMAADDVAAAVAHIALGSPLGTVVEIGGPEVFRLDELIGRDMVSRGDARSIVADPAARYSGAPIEQRTLVPGEAARLGTITYEEWTRERRIS